MDSMAHLSVSKIKITRPSRRSEIVSRQRLIDMLYEQLDKKLILISAPAGYGKTSLLIDLAANSELPTCWLSLDILDQEPQRFITYLIASIAQQFPNFGKESIAAVENLTSFENDGEQLLVAITNEIEEKIPEHFAIVLDDYHLIDPIPVIRQLVSRFLQLSSENVHVILATRNLPDLPDLPLLIARNQAIGLSYEEIAFTAEEIRQFFSQSSNQLLSHVEAELIAKETEGWISAIYLTNKQTGIRPPIRPFEASSDLSDFFAREVYSKQSPEIREFLLVTSLFDTFDVNLCQEVIDPLLEGDRRNWQNLFIEVQSHNLFTVSLGEDGRWMRYHHLFQHFLQAQIHYEKPTLAWHIQHNLAQYFERNEAWEEALHLYETLADQDSLAKVIDKAGPVFLLNGRVVTLANWLERVPISLLDANPKLLSLQGAVYATQGDVPMAVSLLSQAESKFRAKGDTDHLAITLSRRAIAYRQQGKFERALSDAEEAIYLTMGNQEIAAQHAYAEAQRVKGQALFRLGDAEKALNWMLQSLELYKSLDEVNSIPILEMEIGMIYRAKGENQEALHYYELALDAWEKTGNLGWKAVLLNNLGVFHQFRGEFELAFHTLEEALHAAERSGNLKTQALVLNSLGDLLTDLQDIEKARIFHERAIAIAKQIGYSYLVFFGTLSKARIARMNGQITLAESMLQSLMGQIDNISPLQQGMLYLEFGRCMLETNQSDQAAKNIELSLDSFANSNQILEQCIAHLWLAAALSQFDVPSSLDELARLNSPGFDYKNSSALLVQAGQAQPWLTGVLKNKNLNPEIKKFFESAEKFTKNLPVTRRKLRQTSRRILISPPHINIIAFGEARVFHNDQLLLLSDWQTRETRDLFFFLLNYPPQTKDQIAAIFWPDISPSRLRMRFKTNLYRLRRAVGQEVVIFEDDHYYFNKAIDYSYDREYFGVLLNEARKEQQPKERIPFLQKAIDLVKGQYLADIDAEWVLLERNRLDDLYQNALIELASDYLIVNQAQQSLEISERALQNNPLLERAHQLRMRAFSMLRDRAAIAKQYQQCREALQEELGIQPSSETEILYKQLIS